MTRFEQIISYENRSVLHTSRWCLQGVTTRAAGNTDAGWLWLAARQEDGAALIRLHTAPEADAANLVATGAVEAASLPGRVSLTPQGPQGLGGELWLERLGAAAPVTPVLVSLCVDDDLRTLYRDLHSLPSHDPAAGMARFCAEATARTLLLAVRMFPDELGGCGAAADRRLLTAPAHWPDLRRLAAPLQLRPAACHWALEMAMGASHALASDTMFSRLRDEHRAARRAEIATWDLAINLHPDSTRAATLARAAGARRLQRF